MSKPRDAQKYRCSRCSTEKDAEAFHPSQRKTGAWCKECMRSWHRERAGPPPEPRPCEHCGTTIESPDQHRQKYCSANCKQRALYWRRNPHVPRTCGECGTDITRRRRDAIACSARCREALRHKRVTPEQRRAWRLWSKYQITGEDYDRLEAEQDGRCAICLGSDPKTSHGFWHVDHCHTTGAVRGLLCGPCNTGLGSFQDDPDSLRRAADYVSAAG